MRIAVLTALAGAALAIVGIIVQQRRANRREPSPYLALLAGYLLYRIQVAKHVAWRLEGRPGNPPTVDSLFESEAASFVVALRSPGPMAEAAGQLFQQTELLDKEFVRQEPNDPWMPDPREWEEAVAEWLRRAEAYRSLAPIVVSDPA
jgi:hypothetical protein